MKVYLCGPIDGCTDDEATTWRELAKLRLGEDRCLDPMRRDYRGKTDTHCEEIVQLDLEDIDASSIVLANCWQAGWGTPMEIFYTRSKGKAVLAVVPPGSRISPWLRYHATYIYDNLEDAFKFIEKGIEFEQHPYITREIPIG